METLKLLLKTYGFESATVFVTFTGLLSFFGNRYFNIKDKKAELKSNFFYEMKIRSINEFIDSYLTLELCWRHIPYYDILANKLSGAELDTITLAPHNNLLSSYYKLFVILSEYEIKEFTEIYDSMNRIKSFLATLMYDYSTTEVSIKVQDYISFTMDIEKRNKVALKTIGEKFRLEYK